MENERISARKKKMLRRRRKVRAMKAGLLLLCVLIVYGIVQLCLWSYIRKNIAEDKISEGMYVGTVNVSGMTQEEALTAVVAATESYQNASIVMKFDEERSFSSTATDLGVQIVDEKSLVEKAYNYDREGSLFKRWKLIRARKKENQVIDMPFKASTTAVHELLEQQCEPLLKAPVNARLTRENDQTVLVSGEAGEILDYKATLKELNDLLAKDWNGEDENIPVVVKESEPEISDKDLSGIQDLLGSYTTFYNADGTAHAHNVELGATNVGGRMMKVGESLSVETALKPTTEENGYEKGGSFENGVVVQTVGGGICQVSTTLYNAVLYAELEVEARSPHSMLVTYVDPSRDAAIAEGLLDFVFKNNLENPIYIESVLADGNLTFNIYGKETRDPGRTIAFESEVLKTETLDGEDYVTVNEPIGYLVQTAPYTGMDAQLWKVVYQDGQEVSRDVINTSHYQATRTTISVGISSDNQEAASIVSNAVGTHNLENIQAAITEAANLGTE